MAGLTWLASRPGAGSWPFCVTFVRGADELAVLAGFGANLGAGGPLASPASPMAPSVRVMRSGDWVVALEENVPPAGTRPQVLRAVSSGTEAIAIHHDIAKLNHQFAHAVDGAIVTAVTTFVPPHWSGAAPERLRPLAEELGLGGGADADLSDLEVLLALAEGAFGISLDEADLGRLSPPVPIPPTAPRAVPARGAVMPGVADVERVRAHAQRLIDAGMADAAVAARAGMTTLGLSRLLSGTMPRIPGDSAQRILAIELPPPGHG